MMPDDKNQPSLTKGRIFLVLFFGLAIVISIMTILGTWDEQKNGVLDQSQIDQLTGQPVKK